MALPKINPDLYYELAQEGWTNTDIARKFGVSETTVRRQLDKPEYQKARIKDSIANQIGIWVPDPITLEESNVLIAADWHIPLYDPYYVNYMLDVAEANELETLIIPGDLFNHDAISSYEPKQTDHSLWEEWEEARMVARVLLSNFKKIILLRGNHDDRLMRSLGYKLAFQHSMRLLLEDADPEGIIEVSEYDHMWLFNESGIWYICHPISYSRIPLTTPRKQYYKHKVNIICAHAHHCAVGYAEDGKTVLVEAGGVFDKDRTQYLRRSTSYPTWSQGFSFFKNGRFHLDSPGFNI